MAGTVFLSNAYPLLTLLVRCMRTSFVVIPVRHEECRGLVANGLPDWLPYQLSRRCDYSR